MTNSYSSFFCFASRYDLILELLHKGEFPRVHRPSAHSLEVMRQLRYRHRLVKLRTMVKNSLHAIALGGGLSLQSKIGTTRSRQRLRVLALPPTLADQRDEWLSLLDALDTKIVTVEQWLKAAAESHEQVMRLQTHPWIGLITSLALVHTLEPVARFPTARKVVAYVGLDPGRALLGGEEAVWVDQQGGVPVPAVPSGGDGTEGGGRRSGVEDFLLPSVTEERASEGGGGSCQEDADAQLHHAA